MKINITGLPQAGQQQLFSVLTGISLETITQKPMEVHKGVCDVRDPRIIKLTSMYNPKKTTFAKIDYSLLPDFNLQGPSKAMVFNELKNSDEICWVCRGETAKEDIESFVSELIISDLMLVEKRLENIEKDQKKKFQDAREKEKNFIMRCKQLLDENKLVRGIEANADEEVLLRTYQFLSAKPVVAVINVSEGEKADEKLTAQIKEKYSIPAVSMCAELEEEISKLPEADRAEFMKEMGVEEPAVDKMTRVVFFGLGLISFFTVGEDEVRAWPIGKGLDAAQAGGAIHSDIAKGFVRAEMFKYDDLIAAGTEAKLKETGKYYLKGRDYIVEDGDILSFRFNV